MTGFEHKTLTRECSDTISANHLRQKLRLLDCANSVY